jgi:nucleoside-diphosphate-sugar epimerase
MPTRKTKKPLTVAVTGASGYVASKLIEALTAEERVARILGFDVREPAFRHEKFIFDNIDVRDHALRARLEGVDVVVHLAFVMDPIKDEAEMRDINVNGSQNVFRSAGEAGVPKVIYTSSAVAYGAYPDNEVPLTENSPLRANLDFSYSAHKLEVEYVLNEITQEFPKLALTVFRPAIVFGPHADNAWSHLLETPVLFRVQGYEPPLQFVHEDDVGDALRMAVLEDIPGYYNLSADGWLTNEEIVEIVGRRVLDIPESVAFGLQSKLWQVGLAEAPAGMIHYVMHPWVVSNDKLAAAGFRPRHSNAETLAETIEKTKGLVRFGRRRVKRNDLLKGALAGAGLLAAAATVKGVRSRQAS